MCVRAVIGNESRDLNWGSCRDSTAWKARNSSNTNNSLSSNNNKTYCNQIFSMLKFLRKQCLFLVSSKPFGSIKPCFVRWNRPDIKQYKKNQKINGKFELKLRFLQIFISSTSKGITVSKKKSQKAKWSSYIRLSSTLWPKWPSERARKVFSPFFFT